ncbi:hypothetical protein K432DRAFT_444838 [Lepidopterella palustris CBS 459.81]|uniref:Zn(2)-C6 fungal-type domain-containing protein n=1 Tax=Lepidopterella palustris CBS 459.81 TaxID=1314670 RepID=A0A8E2JD55_9PEZI|nr:hypothetical protein K432DRAFT_444838 [Lepidopterella palustris CBS 459.81]
MVNKGPWEQRLVFDSPNTQTVATSGTLPRNPTNITSSGNSDTERYLVAPPNTVKSQTPLSRSTVEGDDDTMVSTSQARNGVANPRACRPCAKAKVKCIARNEIDGPCGRCYRLNKDCVKKKIEGARHRQPSKTRVSLLEQKLDSIINLLAATPGQQHLLAPPVTSRSDTELLDRTFSALENEVADQRKPLNAAEVFPVTGPQSGRSPAPESETYVESIPEFSPGFAQADTLLHRFRTQMTTQFPFVVIPDSMDADRLRREKPFLFRAVMVAASYESLPRQRALGKEVIKYLSKRMIVEGQKSIDLLQGALAMIAWYHLHLFVNQQGTNLLYLVAALLVDLGLNRPPNSAFHVKMSPIHPNIGQAAHPNPRTSDERRALLGCFYLHSVLSKTLKAMDFLRYTPYMEECCQYLMEAREYETDAFLVSLVRLQRIVEGIGQNLSHQDLVNEWWNDRTTTPIELYVKTFRNEIQSFGKGLPSHLQHNAFMSMHCYAAEVYLYECALSSSKRPSHTELHTHPLPTLDLLQSYLLSIQRTISAYFLITPATYFDLPMTTWALGALALIALSKLYALEASNWSPADILAVVDPSKTLDEMITRFMRAKVDKGVTENDIFVFFSRRLRTVKEWFDGTLGGMGRCSSGEMAEGVESAMCMPKAGEKTAMDEGRGGMAGFEFNGFDERFWEEWIGEWDGTLEGLEAMEV